MTASAALHLSAISERINNFNSKPPLGLVLNRAHDATPVNMLFGTLVNQLMEFARYLVRRTDGPGWELKTLEAFQALKGNRVKPRFGVLELHVSQDSIAWTDELGTTRKAVIVNPPKFLANATASVIFRACENANPAFCIDAIKDIASKVGCL